jgi:hypothetical protein
MAERAAVPQPQAHLAAADARFLAREPEVGGQRAEEPVLGRQDRRAGLNAQAGRQLRRRNAAAEAQARLEQRQPRRVRQIVHGRRARDAPADNAHVPPGISGRIMGHGFAHADRGERRDEEQQVRTWEAMMHPVSHRYKNAQIEERYTKRCLPRMPSVRGMPAHILRRDDILIEGRLKSPIGQGRDVDWPLSCADRTLLILFLHFVSALSWGEP